MQAQYSNKLPRVHWDAVHLNYPVRKFPSTELSSETIVRRWRSPQQMVQNLREPIDEMKDYFRDYNVTKELTKSQTATDFVVKLPETNRFNKQVSCAENNYIYPANRKHNERPPRCSAHGKTETQNSYVVPTIPSRLVTEKDQFKHPAALLLDPLPVEISCKKDIEPLDTTQDSYEKYLDPYLTTNRLHHHPYTADQLERVSCSKDVITYYTFANIPWTRTPSPKNDTWYSPNQRHKTLYDREKIKSDFREIRTHNKIQFVPGTFRTESGENYTLPTSAPASKLKNHEEEVRSYYTRVITNLQTNIEQESSNIRNKYPTENSLYGSKKPLCSFFNPFTDKSRRLK